MNSARGSPGINRRVLLMATPALVVGDCVFHRESGPSADRSAAIVE